MNQKVDPNWKEFVLTLLIVMPFICLLGIDHVGKGEVWVAFGTDLLGYVLARIVFRRRTGHWKW